MSMHPEVQVKAREEIEKVVGTDRFPTFEDRHNLPYINAICREVFRVHTVVPNGLPHRAMEDDVYDGNMLHDPETYVDPFKFNPSRFITSQDHKAERDVYDIIFGFGRR
ncbi:hypothetical protein H0H93_014645, partial [Arthromyces matolae]